MSFRFSKCEVLYKEALTNVKRDFARHVPAQTDGYHSGSVYVKAWEPKLSFPGSDPGFSLGGGGGGHKRLCA